MHHWDAIGILLLVVFVVCAVASAFIGYFSNAGMACNIIGYLSLIALITLAVMGKKVQTRMVKVVKTESVEKKVETSSGKVDLIKTSTS